MEEEFNESQDSPQNNSPAPKQNLKSENESNDSEIIDDSDDELDFDEEFTLEDEFDSAAVEKKKRKLKVTSIKKSQDNLTPPDYSKIAQEVIYKNQQLKNKVYL